MGGSKIPLLLHKINDEGLSEWVKCGEAALMDIDEGIFRGAAMADGPTTVAPLLTHNTCASLLDHDGLMIVMYDQRRGGGGHGGRYGGSGYNG